jgi:hypothetical protein
MGNQHISDDLKEAVLHMKAHEYCDEEILEISQLPLSTLKCAARRKCLTSAYRVQKKTNTVLHAAHHEPACCTR